MRTAHFLLDRPELDEPQACRPLRGLDGVKEIRVRIGGLELGVAVVSGLANARRLLEQIRAGRSDLHFIEVMTCPGGCIGGGGQPRRINADAVRAAHAGALRDRPGRPDPSVAREPGDPAAVRGVPGEPLGEKSHHLLHTRYAEREVIR